MEFSSLYIGLLEPIKFVIITRMSYMDTEDMLIFVAEDKDISRDEMRCQGILVYIVNGLIKKAWKWKLF